MPGFTYPSPRTWLEGDPVTAARLRGDMTNLAALYAGGARPMQLSVNLQSQDPGTSTVTLLYIGNIVPLNTWNVPVITTGGQPYYQIPLAGYYLLQGIVSFDTSGSPGQALYSMGFQSVIDGASPLNTEGGAVPAAGSTSAPAGSAGCDLIQFNTYANTADTAAMYGFTSNSSPGVVLIGFFSAEWVGLPTSGLTDYTGSYGTVVSSPQAAASFPSGPGTYITNSGGIAAGAVSMTVHDATGMVTGGTLGLDVIAGQPYQTVAEAVSITGISGTTISISATAYAHAQNAPVAVPVSAAFMNQQCRDIVNFLAYPPLLRAATTTTQALSSQTFPAGTQITSLSETIDTFSGFGSNEYTVPVAGVYFVYGQVYYAGSTSAFAASAGIQVSSGTINWGTQFRSDTSGGAQAMCATVRRHLRLTAGQTVKLYGTQNSGSSMNTVHTSGNYSRLIAVWRSV